MKTKMLLTTIFVMCLSVALFADHVPVALTTVQSPLIKVSTNDDIEALFTDLGFSEMSLEYLGLEEVRIPLDVRVEIDEIVVNNKAAVETLVRSAIEGDFTSRSGQTRYMQLGSYRWVISH